MTLKADLRDEKKDLKHHAHKVEKEIKHSEAKAIVKQQEEEKKKAALDVLEKSKVAAAEEEKKKEDEKERKEIADNIDKIVKDTREIKEAQKKAVLSAETAASEIKVAAITIKATEKATEELHSKTTIVVGSAPSIAAPAAASIVEKTDEKVA